MNSLGASRSEDFKDNYAGVYATPNRSLSSRISTLGEIVDRIEVIEKRLVALSNTIGADSYHPDVKNSKQIAQDSVAVPSLDTLFRDHNDEAASVISNIEAILNNLDSYIGR